VQNILKVLGGVGFFSDELHLGFRLLSMHLLGERDKGKLLEGRREEKSDHVWAPGISWGDQPSECRLGQGRLRI
jgi:hypothetical protein